MTTIHKQTDYDIIIVGGGLVGASLAYALNQQPLRVALIEAAAFKSQSQPNYDDRAIALSYGTRRVFEGMGLWGPLATLATPIKKIHVSDRGHFGVTRIDSAEEGVDALGYVITARDLGRKLGEALNGCDNVDIISPAKVVSLDFHIETAVAHVTQADQTNPLSGKVVVAADGGQSSIRQQLGINAKQVDYGQTAIIANISTDRPHQSIAYERFTDDGPIALLPMSAPSSQATESRYALVWTQPNERAEAIMALGDAAFLARLQERFGCRAGQFTRVGGRASHPLHLIKAREQVQPRLAIIGNAAHTLHPIAGQGFNLGLRDVAALAQTFTDAARVHRDPGGLSVLNDYARWRKRDQQSITGFTDYLVRIFSNDFPPLALARNAGLIATDIFPSIKHTLARHTMGTAGKQPRLARGLPL